MIPYHYKTSYLLLVVRVQFIVFRRRIGSIELFPWQCPHVSEGRKRYLLILGSSQDTPQVDINGLSRTPFTESWSVTDC